MDPKDYQPLSRTLPMRRVYLRVLGTFVRNSLIRDLSFRADFLLQLISSLGWTLMNLLFFQILFHHVHSIGENTGWNRYEAYVFLATVWLVNGIVQTVFMPNAENFSELIRTGNLDFALLKPMDTQFLISFPRLHWPSLGTFVAGLILLGYACHQLIFDAENPLRIGPMMVVLYLLTIACGVTIMYSVTIALASTSVWLGRNQSIYMFWFYLTQFYRYPMEIYQRGIIGWTLWSALMFVLPVLVVANVPARIVAQPLRPAEHPLQWGLVGFSIVAAVASLWISRMIFQRSLRSYRSASS